MRSQRIDPRRQNIDLWAGRTSPTSKKSPGVAAPLQFNLPQVHLILCLATRLVMMIVFIESTGMFLAWGSVR